jgi:alanine dehydrogenase
MNIGVPREHRDDEHRVGLTPAGVELLTADGHVCVVEHEAGKGAGFSDLDYQYAGARIVYSAEEAFGRSEMILKVTRPTAEEVDMLPEGCLLLGFLHLAVCKPDRVQQLLNRKVTAIAYETMQNDDGTLPVLSPLSQIAGRMAPQLAATLVQNNHGGKGILLGGVPGVPPAEVVLIGAGTSGEAAARGFLAAGASVYVLDQDITRLQRLDEMRGLHGRLVTMVSHEFNIRKVVRFADVLVGAVLVPGTRAPIVVTREMVRSMKPRSAILDISIDQGGCVETSRPTTHRDPTFVEEDVMHYCVPNMTSVVARTATHAFNNAAWPYIRTIARDGFAHAHRHSSALRRGVATHGGSITQEALASQMNMNATPL